MLVGIVNSPEFNIEKITIRYFTVGHSFMSADNFHRMVEQEMKAMDKVYDFTDIVKCVSNVGESIIMSHTDFYQYESGLSESKLSKSTRPYLAAVSDVEFRRGPLCLYYNLPNNINNNEFLETDFLITLECRIIINFPKEFHPPPALIPPFLRNSSPIQIVNLIELCDLPMNLFKTAGNSD